jgi:hypothetical protein
MHWNSSAPRFSITRCGASWPFSLFIGARLESPSVVSALLNVDPDESRWNGNDGEDGDGEKAPPALVTCEPEYQMLDALPIALWDCVYAPEDEAWCTSDVGIDGGFAGLHSQLTGLRNTSSRRHRSSIYQQCRCALAHLALRVQTAQLPGWQADSKDDEMWAVSALIDVQRARNVR